MPHEPTPMETLASGADLVTFSGDKLLGGPQAGIILGRRELVQQINANPMKRALRCDKMTIAALTALLRMYQNPEQLCERLPLLRMMTRSPADIRSQATPLAARLGQQLGHLVGVELVDCASEIGSGALPDQTVPSVAIAIRPLPSTAQSDGLLKRLAAAFRQLPVPVIGRIHKGSLLLDCRCLEDTEEFSLQLTELDLGQ